MLLLNSAVSRVLVPAEAVPTGLTLRPLEAALASGLVAGWTLPDAPKMVG